MLRSEHLDVRTVTMGISLFDCAAPDFDTFAYKVRSKILRNAEKLVETCDIVGDRYGIPVVNKRISVSPMATVCAGFTRDQMVEACRVLDDCAKDVGVDFIGGFGALVEKGMTPGERNLIDALPEALATTDRICSSINVGSTKAGINMDAVKLMGERILDVAAATADRDAIGCAKLVVFCNIPQDVPFMAGAYLGVGEPDVVINVGVSGPGVVKKALDRAFEAKGDYLTITDAAEVIKHTAYKVTRVGEIIGNEVAQRLNILDGQQFRRDLAVDGKRRAARVRLPEARTQGHHLFAEGRDALAPDGKSGGKLMSAVAFKQAGQLLQRPEQVEPAVGPRRGLALVAVEADEERRAAVFLRHAGGHDAHHALVPALVRQHDRLRRPAGREHGDGRLIDAAFNLLPPAVESAKRPRQFDRARSVVRQE